MGGGASTEAQGRQASLPSGGDSVNFLVNGRNLQDPNGPSRQPPAARSSAQRFTNRHPNGGVASQKLNQRQKLHPSLGEETEVRALTRNADPLSLQVLSLLQAVDALGAGEAAAKLQRLQECYPLLDQVPPERFDQLAMMVYQKEGEVHQISGNYDSAKDAYARSITLAEKRVARGDKDLYMILKRYVTAMVGLARIWYEHEKEVTGFRFVDLQHPAVAIAANDDPANDSLSSLSSSLSSIASVFSLNQEILKSMAPRPPRSRTGPLFTRVNVKAPHILKGSQHTREDDFVLHSSAARELVASPCELLLLRCCAVVEIGHNCQSELLIPALIELAQIYEDLGLYSRALLLVRRSLGILCSVFDYDHPLVVQLLQRTGRLNALREEQLQEEMATKIQATWKMHRVMGHLAAVLGRPVHRAILIPRKFRTTPNASFLQGFVEDMPMDGAIGADILFNEANTVVEMPYASDRRRFQAPPSTSTVHETSGPHREGGEGYVTTRTSYPERSSTTAAPAHLVSQPGEVVTGTVLLPNARVLGTTQNSQTDTNVQQTDHGDVVTVRTTTVTKTVTEGKASSEEESDSEEDDTGNDMRSGSKGKPHEEVAARSTTDPRDADSHPGRGQVPTSTESTSTAPRCPLCHIRQPPLRCRRCHASQPVRVCHHCNRFQPQPLPVPAGAPTNAVALCVYCQTKQLPARCEQCGAVQEPPVCPYCHGESRTPLNSAPPPPEQRATSPVSNYPVSLAQHGGSSSSAWPPVNTVLTKGAAPTLEGNHDPKPQHVNGSPGDQPTRNTGILPDTIDRATNGSKADVESRSRDLSSNSVTRRVNFTS